MCIAVFIWKSHPLYPFLLLLNRDEYHNRPTTPLGWWEDGEILAGRDTQAGGTWLGCTRSGKLAFLTNVREIRSHSHLTTTTRGDLPIRFLKGNKSPKEFAEELVGEGDRFNGFNLIIADLRCMDMVYITNRPKDDGVSVTEVSPGIHVLSNAKLDTPWPKAQRLRHSFVQVVENKFDAEISLEEITETLMNDTTKDDEESKLPGIYPADFEYPLSAIFVQADSPLGRYGTRSTSALVLRSKGGGVLSFYERNLEKDAWKEQTITFHIETEKVEELV